MTLHVDLFWSFRSPFSYLASGRLMALQERYELCFDLRIVQPIAIRDPDFFKRCNPLFASYLLQDCRRIAEMNDIPFRWPKPDPVVMDLETLEISDDQPYIHRLSRLGVAAEHAGYGLAFINEMSKLIFDGSCDGWDEGDHMAEASARAGLDLAQLDARIASEPEKFDSEISANEQALAEAGHWGVPTMAFQGEPFFGQDRIEVLLWRLKQNGLRKRQS